MIKKVNISMSPILNGYGVMSVNCRKHPPMNCLSQVTPRNPEPAGTASVSKSCNLQLTTCPVHNQAAA